MDKIFQYCPPSSTSSKIPGENVWIGAAKTHYKSEEFISLAVTLQQHYKYHKSTAAGTCVFLSFAFLQHPHSSVLETQEEEPSVLK